MSLETSTRVVRDPELYAAQLDGETVMMNLETSRYYGLNRVGSRVWELLAQPMSVSELCGTLQDEFEVTPEACEQEVAALVQKLVDEKLVRIV